MIAVAAWAVTMSLADPVGAAVDEQRSSDLKPSVLTDAATITYTCSFVSVNRIITRVTIAGLTENYNFSGNGAYNLLREYPGPVTLTDCIDAAVAEQAALVLDGWTTGAVNLVFNPTVQAVIAGDHSALIIAVNNAGVRLVTASVP